MTSVRSSPRGGDGRFLRLSADARRKSAIGLFLAVATIAVYLQVGAHPFISLDDPAYISENAIVRAGLTPEGFAWAFTTRTAGNWHPLTWLSHMLDVRLFGLDAGAHHLVGVLFHAANALLLFLVLARMTSDVRRSAFVAALFALHPLHVESVAWAAERKDVLSAFFMSLALLSYARYAARPGLARYLPVAIFTALGLLSKPMLVTLPFLLLLLDYWPLGRLRPGAAAGTGGAVAPAKLVAEKIPLFAMAAASCALTYMAQREAGAVSPVAAIPLGIRAMNAAVSYVAYMGKAVWPSRLAAFYPHPWNSGAGMSAVAVGGAVLLLAAVSWISVREAGRRPWLPVGWFWYAGSLVPVAGLVQVGLQAMADRYTYVPLTGIFICAAWGIPGLPGARRVRGRLLAAAAAAALAALSAATFVRVSQWRSTAALFEHDLAVTSGNYGAHMILGAAFVSDGRVDEGIAHLREAIRIFPDFEDALVKLGAARLSQGRFDEAGALFLDALSLNPGSLEASYRLGLAMAGKGRDAEAEAAFRKAERYIGGSAPASYNFAVVLAQRGKTAEAIAWYGNAIALKADYADARSNLGSCLARIGRTREAVAQFREALRLNPGDEVARGSLAVLGGGAGIPPAAAPR